MTIQILGPGCKRCAALQQTAITAASQLGLDASVEKIEDYAEMARLGVMSTPALAVDGRVLSAGSVPSVRQVRDLLAAASA
jgi:small redox-active disulfide protein 2